MSCEVCFRYLETYSMSIFARELPCKSSLAVVTKLLINEEIKKSLE